MQYLVPYWLSIKDPHLAHLYNKEQTMNIFKTALGLTIARAGLLVWAIISFLNQDQQSYFRASYWQLCASLIL